MVSNANPLTRRLEKFLPIPFRRQYYGREKLSVTDIVRVLVLALVFAGLATAILVLDIIPGNRVALEPGDVSPIDIRAPRSIRYISDVRTRAAREQAAQQVRDVYDAPQPQVARQQLARLRDIVEFITTVRSNPYADLAQKVREVQAITDLNLPEDMARALVTMSAERWRLVADQAQQTLRIAMSREIREGELAAARSRVPLLVDQSLLTEREASIVTHIVQALLRPNSFLNRQKTEIRREEAREAVVPVEVEYEAGEIIVRSGEVATEEQVEALDKLGLRQQRITWSIILSNVLLVTLFTLLHLLYTYRFYRPFWLDPYQPPLFYVSVLLFLVLAKALVPGHALLALVFPLGALVVIISTLADRGLALLVVGFMGFVAGHLSGDSLLLSTHTMAGAMAMMLLADRAERLAAYLWGAVALSITQIAVLFFFALDTGDLNSTALLQQSGASLINGILSASLTLIGFYALGFLFGTTTIIQLLDLARPNHPLLQELMTKAPGTYHHILVVSNLAERAAAAVGADAFLTRVGTYYHDIGKIRRPHFFTENQQGGMNPHEHLDPRTSAQVIISHVADGLELARRYRLPQRIVDFITEHHGTTLVAFFYRKAVEANGGNPEGVDERDFRYPGPRPRSKETAILMLADAVEAIARSRHPQSREELERLVHKVIMDRLAEGQLDDAPLTMRDLDTIQQAFVEMLAGIYHTRVSYPEPASLPGEEETGGEELVPAGQEGSGAVAGDVLSGNTEVTRAGRTR